MLMVQRSEEGVDCCGIRSLPEVRGVGMTIRPCPKCSVPRRFTELFLCYQCGREVCARCRVYWREPGPPTGPLGRGTRRRCCSHECRDALVVQAALKKIDK